MTTSNTTRTALANIDTLSTEITLLTTLANALETAATATKAIARIHEARGDSTGARVARGSAVDWSDTARDVRATIAFREDDWVEACEAVEPVVRDCYGNVIEVGDTVVFNHDHVERTGTVLALLDAQNIEVRLPNGARLLKLAHTVEYRP